jgi:hypothetical protein
MPSPIQKSVARAKAQAANTPGNSNTVTTAVETDEVPSNNIQKQTSGAVTANATATAASTTPTIDLAVTDTNSSTATGPGTIANQSSEAADEMEGDKDNKDDNEEQPEAASQSVEQLKASLGFGESAANGQLDDETEHQLFREQFERGTWNEQDAEADGIGGRAEGNQQQTRMIIQQVERIVPGSQEVFQPGATPESNSRRYLAWNQVGLITSRYEGTHSAIEIDFADKGYHRNLRFTDYLGFTMSALSRTGAVFATPGPEHDDENDEDEEETRRRKLVAAADADMLGDPGKFCCIFTFYLW